MLLIRHSRLSTVRRHSCLLVVWRRHARATVLLTDARSLVNARDAAKIGLSILNAGVRFAVTRSHRVNQKRKVSVPLRCPVPYALVLSMLHSHGIESEGR